MFGLFKAKPPLSPWEKAWTEDRMVFLANELGMARMLETPTLLPGHASIPQAHDADSAAELLRFVQTWMKLDEMPTHLRVFSDAPTTIESTPPSNAVVIEVHETQLEESDLLLPSMARQLARAALLERGNCNAGDEWTFDLMPAFLGLGIFAANALIKTPSSTSDPLHWWSARQRGYLPSRMFGYALAVRTTTRMDQDQSWASLLRQDAQVAFLDGMKYLAQTDDSIFNRDSTNQPRSSMASGAIQDELQSASPSLRIAAMWELARRAEGNTGPSEAKSDQRVAELLMDNLRHKQAEVRAVAAATLPHYDRSPHAAQDVADALGDAHEEVRIAAAGALGHFAGVDDQTMVHDLTKALKDDVRLVVFNAARSLTYYGKAAEPATKTLLQRLRRAMVECRDEDAVTVMWALDAIVDDAKAAVSQFFVDSDAEFREFALQILEQLGERDAIPN